MCSESRLGANRIFAQEGVYQLFAKKFATVVIKLQVDLALIWT
jgi:hypothetical protein